MKKSRLGKRIATGVTGLAFTCALFFTISTGGGIDFLKGKDAPSDRITASAANKNANYDEFADSVKCYYYSDVNRIVDFHRGVASATKDVETQDVDLTKDHGTAANPFVINTAEQWNAFAKDTTNATKGDKVFVLGSDIDFTGKTFTPVPSLGAKFYGTNHKLINVTYDFKSAGTCGLFCTVTSGAIVTDVSLDNVNFTNAGSHSGFICGTSNASILNCHVHGKMTGSTTNSYGIGGIVGNVQDNSARVYVYRCSVFADFNINPGNDGGMGAICGDADRGAGLSVYDCLTICNYTFHDGRDPWFGGVINSGAIGSSAIHEIENVVAYSNVTETSTMSKSYKTYGSLYNGWATAKVSVQYKATNTYTSGDVSIASAAVPSGYVSSHDMYSGLFWVNDQMNSNITTSGSNINWFATNPRQYSISSSYSTDLFDYRGVSTNRWDNSTNRTREDMWKAMVKDSAFSTKIWVNKSKISETYMTNTDVTSTTGYTIENSPVRNPLIVRVSYFELKDGKEVAMTFDGVTQPDVKNADDDLAIPAARTNRIFVGWTTDKNWTADKMDTDPPFKTMPTTLIGDNKLYAVWELDQKTVDISVTGTGSDFAYDSTKSEASMTFNGTGRPTSGITLTANLTADGIDDSDADIKYQWLKGGEDADGNGKAQTYKVENVRQSGSYTVSLTITSKSEPLFFGEVKAENVMPVIATINPAPLTCDGVTFADETGRPYSGAPYSTAKPLAIIKNSDGVRVNGEASWAYDLFNFNDLNGGNKDNISNGKERTSIRFEPSEEDYHGNYGDFVNFDVEITIEYLQFQFYVDQINKMTLTSDIEYGSDYSYADVVDKFEKVFEPYSGKTGGNAPAFVVNGQNVKISEYRNYGTTENNIAYAAVTQNHKIDVVFVPQTFTVTFDPDNGDEPTEQTYRYGVIPPKPLDPVKDGLMFLGWYYVDSEGNDVQWVFQSDRVTKDVTLYARWLAADTLVGLHVEELTTRYVAKQPVDPSGLKVTAEFSGTAGEQTHTQTVQLFFGQYDIIYENNTTVLHAKAGNETTAITITYTFRKGSVEQTKTVTLDVQVEKIALDTSTLKKYFPDTAVVVDGNPQTMTPIDPNFITNEIPELSGCSVTYKYYNSQEAEITDPNEVKETGIYFVRAYFTPKDTDYDAPYIQAKFQIVNEKIKLHVNWGETTFDYNGKEQMPTPTFTNEKGEAVEVNYTLQLAGEEGAAAIKAGTDYAVTVKVDLAYELLDNATTGFVIRPITVKVPTQIKPFPYEGREYDLNALGANDCKLYFEGFDLTIMRVRSGDGVKGDKGIDATRYNAMVEILDPDSATFEGGTTSAPMSWQIAKAKLLIDWSSYEFYENGGVQSPVVSSFYPFFGDDESGVDYTQDVEYMGDITAMTYGEYTVTVVIKPDAPWAKNYELDSTAKTCSFVILPKVGMEPIKIVWDSNTLLKYNGSVQRPTFKVYNRLGEDITASVPMGEFRFNEEAQNSKYEGDYTAIVTMRPGSNYFLTGDTSCEYSIELNEAGEGKDPNAGTPTTPSDPGNTGDDKTEETNQLPIWQLIVTGVSAVLLVVCAAKAFTNYSKAKAARKEAQELATTTYAVNYAFAPLPLLAIEFLGIGETPWTIIAFVTLGLFLAAFAAMLLFGKKRKAAELLLRREQARIADEKEYAREEEQMRREEELRAEQRRRDEEFKMMFAAMQQGNQAQYGDMQNLIASTVSALLPAMQQMQALPPAPGDSNAYNAPQNNYGAQPNYGAPQPDYNASNYGGTQSPETDALRAQMAAQEERMARQEALINELMQERQANRAYSAPAETYSQTEAENARQEELLTQFDANGGTPVSLEESYGNLSDEAKRYYYEIGCFIMERLNVMQNDGKYAVLFKYRGKTLFKLSIKNDAPVLTYIQNGTPVEQSVVDDSTLGYAKQIMAACIAATDKELDG